MNMPNFKSATNMVDKQDISFVEELASLYQLFLEQGYHVMGMYLKGLIRHKGDWIKLIN